MHFTIQREALLKPLQLVAGVVERRQTLPVLSNVLLVVEGQQLSLTGTDLEVELVGRVTLEDAAEPGEITVPARKLMDICKSLPSDALIDIRVDDQKLLVKAGRSRFTLSTLPANDFPTVEEGPGSLTFNLPQAKLRRLIERTSLPWLSRTCATTSTVCCWKYRAACCAPWPPTVTVWPCARWMPASSRTANTR